MRSSASTSSATTCLWRLEKTRSALSLLLSQNASRVCLLRPPRGAQLLLTALNSTKSAYACFTFATTRFFSRYTYVGTALHREKFYCTLYIRVRFVSSRPGIRSRSNEDFQALISIFRSRSGDLQRDRELQSSIDKCDVAIEDGPNVASRFVAKLTFRNGTWPIDSS
jgi:cell cycle checkpoint control protein RAD9A